MFYPLSETPPLNPEKFPSGVHSEVEPPLPIPNRTVKRLRADDSALPTRAKVGQHQTPTYTYQNAQPINRLGVLLLCR